MSGSLGSILTRRSDGFRQERASLKARKEKEEEAARTGKAFYRRAKTIWESTSRMTSFFVDTVSTS